MFQASLCGEHLIELSNPGASGSVFYRTQDDQFVIKTVSKREAGFCTALLPGYYMVSTRKFNTGPKSGRGQPREIQIVESKP